MGKIRRDFVQMPAEGLETVIGAPFVHYLAPGIRKDRAISRLDLYIVPILLDQLLHTPVSEKGPDTQRVGKMGDTNGHGTHSFCWEDYVPDG